MHFKIVKESKVIIDKREAQILEILYQDMNSAGLLPYSIILATKEKEFLYIIRGTCLASKRSKHGKVFRKVMNSFKFGDQTGANRKIKKQ